MASSKKDIVPGAIFRPRSVVTQVKLRPNDTLEILSYIPPILGAKYRSDGATVMITDTDLLNEYKIQATPSKSKPSAEHAVKSEKPFDIGLYVPGSLWSCNVDVGTYSENPFVANDPIKLISQDAEITIYAYLSNLDAHKQKKTITFRKFTKPYTGPTDTHKAKPVCPHTDADWLGDVKSCSNCGEIVQTISPTLNPYNVDPDLKKIPDEVTMFINRVARSIEG